MSAEPEVEGQGGSRPLPTPRAVPRWVETIGKSSWYFLGFCGAVVVVALMFALAKDLTLPLVLALFLAAILFPAVEWADRRGVPRTVAAAGMVTMAIAVVIMVGALVVGGLSRQGDELGEVVDGAVEELEVWADDLDLDAGDVEAARQSLGDAVGELDGGVASRFIDLVDSTFALIAGAVLGTLILYYLLKDGPQLAERMISGSRRGDPAVTRDVLRQSVESVQAYFRGKTALALVQGTAIAVIVALLGVPLAFTVGIVNFVGAYIPYLGAFIGGAFAVLLALSEGGAGLAAVVLVVVVGVNLGLENLLEPRLLGEQLDFHPLAMLIVTILGGMIAGIVGLILAAPLAAIGRTVYRQLRASGFFDEDQERVRRVYDRLKEDSP